ncbi:MAG: STAS domain-containing protein [Eubacterium sp.]|nr:STAS domain-containing protein [Eubacterium sp.]
MSKLEINKTVEGTKYVFMPEGEINTNTAPEFEKELDAALSDVTEMIIDFEKVTYVSSAGLRAVIATYTKIEGKAEMKLINMSEGVREVFEMTGFADYVNIE